MRGSVTRFLTRKYPSRFILRNKSSAWNTNHLEKQCYVFVKPNTKMALKWEPYLIYGQKKFQSCFLRWISKNISIWAKFEGVTVELFQILSDCLLKEDPQFWRISMWLTPHGDNGDYFSEIPGRKTCIQISYLRACEILMIPILPKVCIWLWNALAQREFKLFRFHGIVLIVGDQRVQIIKLLPIHKQELPKSNQMKSNVCFFFWNTILLNTTYSK